MVIRQSVQKCIKIIKYEYLFDFTHKNLYPLFEVQKMYFFLKIAKNKSV